MVGLKKRLSKGLEANKQTFWYALYDHEETVTDIYGNEIGSRSVYSNPVKHRANISASRGPADNELFGINAVYSRTINPLPLDFPMNEASILWVDKQPEINEDGSTNTGHDYVVTNVAPSLNHRAYAILRVDVADTRTLSEDSADGEDDTHEAVQ